uniref:Uncharacterized protein n=1 Tax=Neobodo designis TaxID=312471 RepID=A0A7S1MT70_NEODS|mmetsp:Transcript_46365/g.143068  ORF Transcript_46365/g.143068 Transcript_46365/m.143068 type:complete len:305 (+) Transcript_46365:113-1027(+)
MGSCCSADTGGPRRGYAHDSAPQTVDPDEGADDPAVAPFLPHLWVLVQRRSGRLELRECGGRRGGSTSPSARRRVKSTASTGSDAASAGESSGSSHGSSDHRRPSPSSSSSQRRQRHHNPNSVDIGSQPTMMFNGAVSANSEEAFRNLAAESTHSSITDFESDGRVTAEPCSVATALREAGTVVRARLKYDINGDVDQFEPPAEHPLVLRASISKCAQWLPESFVARRRQESPGINGVLMKAGETPAETSSGPARAAAANPFGTRARRAPLTVDALDMHHRLLQWSEADAARQRQQQPNGPPTT